MIVPQKPVYLRGVLEKNLIEKNLTIEEKNWWLNEVGLLEFGIGILEHFLAENYNDSMLQDVLLQMPTL